MKNKINLSDDSLLELISILSHDLDAWAEFYTDTCPFDCNEENICEVSTNELKRDIEKALNPWNIDN